MLLRSKPPTMNRKNLLHAGFTTIAVLLLFSLSAFAQTQPVFRIGILDSEDGALSRGSRLAVQEINASGGVTGADGTVFRLELVNQAPDDLPTAVSNINQASVIAVIGPETSATALAGLAELQSLGVPILTSATDDTIIAIDTTDRIFRIRAQELLLGRALVNYLVSDLNIRDIITIQLDIQSTAGIIGFTTALSTTGIPVRASYLLDENSNVDDLVARAAQANPGAIVAYGPPATTNILYAGLRASGWNGRFVYNQATESNFRANLSSELLTGIISATTWAYSSEDEVSEGFLTRFVRNFGSIPGEIEAASYDAIYLIAEAISLPGDLATNLSRVNSFIGIQGPLNPAQLARGELSNNTAIVEIGAFGAPQVTDRFVGNQRFDEIAPEIIDRPAAATPTPAATATPEGVVLTITNAVQNVRTGPGLEYAIIGQLQQGDQAQVIGANLDYTWLVINFRGQQGWLSRGILDVFGPLNTLTLVAAPPTPTPPPATFTPIPPSRPDLIVTSAIPSRLPIGNPFSVTVTIRNQGTLDAGAFAVAATFAPGTAYSAVNLPGLGAGQQTNITLTGVLAGPTGPQNVVIIADLNNQVDEGPEGEANNDDFIFSYIADNTILTPGGQATVTLAPGGTINFDAGTNDMQWSGTDIVALNGAQIYLLSGFSGIDQVHYDAISTSTNASPINFTLLTNALIGLRTDDGKRGVIRIDSAPSGGNLVITYRIYN